MFLQMTVYCSSSGKLDNDAAYLNCTTKVAPGFWQVHTAIIARLMLWPSCLAPVHTSLTLVMKQADHRLHHATRLVSRVYSARSIMRSMLSLAAVEQNTCSTG